jgi:hypothetical protein
LAEHEHCALLCVSRVIWPSCMPRPRAFALAFCVALIAIALLLRTADDAPEADARVPLGLVAPSGATTDPEHATGSPPRGSSPHAESAAFAQLALPPLPRDSSFGDLLAVLRQRAERGDLAAECGLGLLLTHCKFLLNPAQKGTPDALWTEGLQAIALHETDAVADELEGWRDMQEEDRRACAALSPQQRQRAPWHFVTGARRGHLPSMRRLVMGFGVDEAALLRDPALYQVFRHERGQTLIRLIERGDPFAAMEWASALGSARESSSLAAVLPRDWHARGVALALNRRIDRELGLLKVIDLSLSISDADEMAAERLFSRYFEKSEPLRQQRARLDPDRVPKPPRQGRDLARPPLRECDLEHQ